MIYLLKPATEKAGIKLKSVKGEKTGRCEFCGREKDVAVRDFISWLKGANNPGITKSVLGYPEICVDCASVLVSGIRTSSLVKGLGGTFIISGYGEDGKPVAKSIVAVNTMEIAEKIGDIPKGIYVVLFFLKKGNYLPIVDLPNLKATVEPAVSLTVNVVEGSMMRTEIIPTELLYADNPKGIIKLMQNRILREGGKE